MNTIMINENKNKKATTENRNATRTKNGNKKIMQSKNEAKKIPKHIKNMKIFIRAN